MPYYKVGREYRFPIEQLKEWEIRTKHVFCGKGQILYLPAWIEYRNQLKNEIALAKSTNNKELLRQARAELNASEDN